MKLPSRFKLAGRKWKVKLVPRKRIDRATRKQKMPDADALCSPVRAVIWIADDVKKRSKRYQRVVFLHELTHAIKFTRGETDHREVEVDGFAQLWDQFERTAK